MAGYRDEVLKFWRHLWRQEAFANGMRALLALASVTIAAWYGGEADEALIPLLLGVIAGALAESDHSWRGQVRVQLLTLMSFTVVAWAVHFSQHYTFGLLYVLAVSAFVLTMVGAIGERYRALAVATLIMALYTALAGERDAPESTLPWSLVLLLCGAAWYGVISVLWAATFPALHLRQKTAYLYRMLGHDLQLKSRLLAPIRDEDLEERRLALALHNGRVVDALNAVKESLFLRVEAGPQPRWLMQVMQAYFVAQDIHERVTSSHDHYGVLVNAFFHSDVLYRCQRVLALLGQDCQALARSIPTKEHWQPSGATERALDDLEAAIRHQTALLTTPERRAEAQRPMQSLRALAENLKGMVQQFHQALGQPDPSRLPADSSLLNRNVHGLSDAWARVRAHLKLSSPVFRHAVRLSLALSVGYLVIVRTGDRYGLWILLTIVFVCLPQYGSTLTRLAQRTWGTLVGLVVGWALLRLFPGVWAQSVFTVFAGGLFFATRQTRYTIATAAITSLVLLSFNQVGDGLGVIRPRMIDTLVGSLIAGLAVWLVLPSWQSRQIHRIAANSLRMQAVYLREIVAQYQQGRQDNLSYRLARRNAHNADAALSSAVSAMTKEPGYIRRRAGEAQNFLVLSHTMLNYVSALGAHRDDWVLPPAESAASEALANFLNSLELMAQALERRSSDAAPVGPEPAAQASVSGFESVLGLAVRLLPSMQAEAARLVRPSER
jgi:YccS/YhfK family integral membrane protein